MLIRCGYGRLLANGGELSPDKATYGGSTRSVGTCGQQGGAGVRASCGPCSPHSKVTADESRVPDLLKANHKRGL
ncbi:hypothetical protein AAFF_G00158810 [Aldrovandia affinis]|uniref:Uncharacterized protein n=1 Tax=Aldrovandia affinis TaxID=143900 RepID=A0AAD7RNI1_9TELE|nr:hypothetical protein AAFF_G00158810 [Aldrovandia affinis]